MKFLIKVGGTLLDDAKSRAAIAHQLAEASREHELAVVHGGGKQVTRYLEERGLPSRFVNGLRVSDEAVIDAVVKNIAGTVNKQLVAEVLAAGEAAVGLSGIDGPLTLADPWGADLGWVGKPVRTDGRLLDLLVNAGYLPIIACIAADRHGNIYNVNADQMAVSCAVGWGASCLLFLTDVPGVKNADGAVLSSITPKVVRELVTAGVAGGGMQAKLEAAVTGIAAGVSEMIIANGRELNICNRLLSGERLGTRLTSES